MAAMDIEMTSPVGPLVAVAYDQDHTFGIPVRIIICIHDLIAQRAIGLSV